MDDLSHFDHSHGHSNKGRFAESYNDRKPQIRICDILKNNQNRAMADSVATWYNENANVEDQRLDVARVEYAITLHVLRDLVAEIQQRTSRERLWIADIGCGTGQYGT